MSVHHPRLTHCVLLAAALALCLPAQAEPQLSSIFPIGGPRGEPFEVEVGGNGFHDVFEVIFACPRLKATTRTVPTGKDSPPRLFMKVEAHAETPIGWHRFRLLAKHGLSRWWQVFIHDEPNVVEAAQPEGTPQRVEAPCAIQGKIVEPGDADYYAIEVAAGEVLSFELHTTSGLFQPGQNQFAAPEFHVLETGGSWFDPTRSSVIRCEDRSGFHFLPERPMTMLSVLPRFTHRFADAGVYLLRVTESGGFGSELYSYQLRVRRAEIEWTSRRFVCADPHRWREHEFHVPLKNDRLDRIWSRTAHEPEGGRESLRLGAFVEREGEEEMDVSIPVLIIGKVDAPGDSDVFPFTVADGDALAFEVRALKVERPQFFPRLVVEDEQGREVFNNTFRKLGGDGDDWIKSLEAKVLFTFEKGGRFRLRMRDITSRRGGPDFEYRVLIRKQVPHVGEVDLNVGRVNLGRGGSVRLDVDVHREEGYRDDLALDVLDLPPGVRILPADRVLPDTGPPFPAVEKERFVATMHSLSVLVVVDDDAAPTPRPQRARVVVRPLLNGKAGTPIVVQELPVMILP